LIFLWLDWSHHAFHGTQAEYNFFTCETLHSAMQLQHPNIGHL
jgi:hypothetical protein